MYFLLFLNLSPLIAQYRYVRNTKIRYSQSDRRKYLYFQFDLFARSHFKVSECFY